MCTIVVINHHYKEFPLVIAANRDEDYNRPSSVVQVLAREPHLIVGGKDELKGGTWLGVNKHSLFVGLTNQGTKNDKLESRGLLVMEALKCDTIEKLLSFVEGIDPAKYSKFNLVFGNSKAVFIAHSYLLHCMVIRELSHGVHVITSDMKFTDEPSNKIAYVHKKLDAATEQSWLDYYKVLKKTLASSEYGMKIKPRKRESGTLHGHCTRSSSILAFSDAGLERYKFHDRTTPRPKKKALKEGEALPPRYKDYIDVWRGIETPVSVSEEKDDDDNEEETPKDVISDILKRERLRLRLESMRSYDDRFDDDD